MLTQKKKQTGGKEDEIRRGGHPKNDAAGLLQYARMERNRPRSPCDR